MRPIDVLIATLSIDSLEQRVLPRRWEVRIRNKKLQGIIKIDLTEDHAKRQGDSGAFLEHATTKDSNEKRHSAA